MILLLNKENKNLEYKAKKYYSTIDECFYYFKTKCLKTNNNVIGKSYVYDILQQWTKEKLEVHYIVIDTDSDDMELLEALYGDLSRLTREGGVVPTENAKESQRGSESFKKNLKTATEDLDA